MKDLKSNIVLNEDCTDVNFDEAITLSIDELFTKYKSENELLNSFLAYFPQLGYCHLLTDQSKESKGILNIDFLKWGGSKLIFNI